MPQEGSLPRLHFKKWCCMMMPRLKLLRELLRDDSDYI